MCEAYQFEGTKEIRIDAPKPIDYLSYYWKIGTKMVREHNNDTNVDFELIVGSDHFEDVIVTIDWAIQEEMMEWFHTIMEDK